MTIKLFQDVALVQDLPEHKLRAGDIATVIDIVQHPSRGEVGCVLEVFNAVGESIAVITVPLSAVEALSPNEILSVRQRALVS